MAQDLQERMMAPEESIEVVLARMDGRLGVVEEGQRELRSEVRSGFAGLTFTRSDVYEANRATDKEYAAETREIAIGARTIAMWALGIMIVAALAAFAGLIRLIAV